MTDWSAWHDDYADPTSNLSRRLAFVQANIRDWLNSVTGPVVITSACAGDGRDVLEVLSERDDAGRATVTLIELDDRNADRAQATVDHHRIPNVTIKRVDAGSTDAYADCTPADLLLICGVLGNITDEDAHRLIQTLPSLCRTGTVVLWTRGRWQPDLTPALREWFQENGFEEESFTAPRDVEFSVGRHRFAGDPAELQPGQSIFTFTR